MWQGDMHGGGGACVAGVWGMHGRVCVCGMGVCMAGCVCGGWGCAWQGACMVGKMAIAVDSTHPTGMHSC